MASKRKSWDRKPKGQVFQEEASTSMAAAFRKAQPLKKRAKKLDTGAQSWYKKSTGESSPTPPEDSGFAKGANKMEQNSNTGNNANASNGTASNGTASNGNGQTFWQKTKAWTHANRGVLGFVAGATAAAGVQAGVAYYKGRQSSEPAAM